jgi:hypothetical protein
MQTTNISPCAFLGSLVVFFCKFLMNSQADLSIKSISITTKRIYKKKRKDVS